MTKPTFIGVSTVDGSLNPLYDTDIIKQDLMNEIHTRKGERLMNPEYGSIIWDLLFENKSPATLSDIQNDLKRIIDNEPRVTLQQMELVEQEHGYVGFITLYYNQFKTAEQIRIEFNSETGNEGSNETGS